MVDAFFASANNHFDDEKRIHKVGYSGRKKNAGAIVLEPDLRSPSEAPHRGCNDESETMRPPAAPLSMAATQAASSEAAEAGASGCKGPPLRLADANNW